MLLQVFRAGEVREASWRRGRSLRGVRGQSGIAGTVTTTSALIVSLPVLAVSWSLLAHAVLTGTELTITGSVQAREYRWCLSIRWGWRKWVWGPVSLGFACAHPRNPFSPGQMRTVGQPGTL